MADVVLNHIYKVYPNGVQAVTDFCINIKDKEFIVFVGPSGCGKSTTLRMVAGLEEITAGDLYIGDKLVNDVQPKERDIAMVFQNYALYPHMTVYENIAFSLRNKHMAKDKINKLVMEAARILDIEDYLQRKPKEMSGGQRQRVALGRAIVRNPKVFLLDEPLSNLDAKLRASMRTEITKLHKKLATTFIYVTHDQVEAMTMGTRIVVMKDGFVQQIDSPTNLYNHPINKFVAGFIGTPQMNFFDSTLKLADGKVEIAFEDKQKMSLSFSDFVKCDPEYIDGKKNVTIGIRPDNVKIADKKGPDTIDVIITSLEKLGNETLLYCGLGNVVTTDDAVTKSSVIIKTEPNYVGKIGDIISVKFNGILLQVFDKETEVALMPYFPTYSRITLEIKDKVLSLFGQEIAVPGAYKSLKKGKYIVKIPNNSISDGKEFALPCYKCEKMEENKYLITLQAGSEYLFATSPIEIKKGEEVKFNVELEDIEFHKDVELQPVLHNVEAVGQFIKLREKNEKGATVVNFYAEINGAKCKVSDNFISRFVNIEGRKSLSEKFRLKFVPKVLDSSENAISHEVIDVLDYGKKQYLKAKVGETLCYIDITTKFDKKKKDFDFSFDETQPIAVYTLDTNVKII